MTNLLLEPCCPAPQHTLEPTDRGLVLRCHACGHLALGPDTISNKRAAVLTRVDAELGFPGWHAISMLPRVLKLRKARRARAEAEFRRARPCCEP